VVVGVRFTGVCAEAKVSIAVLTAKIIAKLRILLLRLI
jgi:hypothetical protein